MSDMEGFCLEGHRPWLSPYYGEVKRPEEVYGADTQEQINKCLSCTKILCTNCASKQKYKYDREKLMSMILAGKRTELICKALGVRETTVRKAKEEIGW